MVPGRADITEVKVTVDNILGDDKDKKITLPLKDLIWTIVHYNLNIRDLEDKIHSDVEDNIILNKKNHFLLVNKECNASRADELVRLISAYSNFSTGRIYEETDKIFKK